MKNRAAVLDTTPIDKTAQGIVKRFPKKPSAISALYTLKDLETMGINWYQVYKAADEGRLHALRRHKRLFYAEHEVRAVFGPRIFSTDKCGWLIFEYENEVYPAA